MKKLEKFKVCEDCHSSEIVDKYCVCVTEKNYKTIELEFEVCECCGHVDTYPADTPFNDRQLGQNLQDEIDYLNQLDSDYYHSDTE